MYCSNCGKEIYNDEKFCKYCGNLINKELHNEENNTKKVGMKYFDFYSKFYLCFIIIINMLGFLSFSGITEWNIYTYSILIIDIILYVLLPIKLLNDLRKKTKFIYKLLLAFLLLDYLYRVITLSFTTYINHPNSSLVEYVFISIFMLGVWFIPNLIYFIKRKDIFVN
nr:MAG TPA: zinc-ribbon containing domain protein [Caudoviricetes sp.]